ncbi:MAG: hypothetical protein DRP75_04765 [Candidatus Omnitrophota bacterium]|nr:MAG: hypothetical protein DRP75_04765 [Candidatus Omnitrophota bacterium]
MANFSDYILRKAITGEEQPYSSRRITGGDLPYSFLLAQTQRYPTSFLSPLVSYLVGRYIAQTRGDVLSAIAQQREKEQQELDEVLNIPDVKERNREIIRWTQKYYPDKVISVMSKVMGVSEGTARDIKNRIQMKIYKGEKLTPEEYRFAENAMWSISVPDELIPEEETGTEKAYDKDLAKEISSRTKKPAQQRENLEKMRKWADLLSKYGLNYLPVVGSVITSAKLGPGKKETKTSLYPDAEKIYGKDIAKEVHNRIKKLIQQGEDLKRIRKWLEDAGFNADLFLRYYE